MDRLVPAHTAAREDLAASGKVAFAFASRSYPIGFEEVSVAWERYEGVGFHAADVCSPALAFLLLPHSIDASVDRRTLNLGAASVFGHEYLGAASVDSQRLRSPRRW
jgi:hypothetical protein